MCLAVFVGFALSSSSSLNWDLRCVKLLSFPLGLTDSDELPLIRNTPSTNLVVSGLGKYSNYSVVVLAFTEAGDGPSSNEIFCHTEEDSKRWMFLCQRLVGRLRLVYMSSLLLSSPRKSISYQIGCELILFHHGLLASSC